MSLEKPILWSSESNQAKIMAISTLLHQKMEEFMTPPHSMLIKFYFLIFDFLHVILVHTLLTRL